MLDRFERGELDPAAFRHSDHVGVAFAALEHHGFFEALLIYANGLKVLVEKAGKPEKFNATVTFAYMSAISERMHLRPANDASGFIAENPDLLSGSVLNGYSQDRLQGDLAKRIALMPDRSIMRETLTLL
ncbi:hypothetical protein [uncultured Hoeflea sp.]|uniref:hypothetical protein n=1 Tax=uncultured Hoeflea sp. TaxID=538666 RepID=UPI0026264BB8|nr:hypothetical protein [uncultured Hoeflea sp.]